MAPGLQSIALFSQIVVDHAEGCTITDVDGNQYLDFIAGIAVGSVGHSHPHYVKRIKEERYTRVLGARGSPFPVLARSLPPRLARDRIVKAAMEPRSRRYSTIPNIFSKATAARDASSWRPNHPLGRGWSF